MANPRPTTIDNYIRAAPGAGQPHLRAIHAILKSAAPQVEETIKWGNLFFVEPRFVYAFSGHKGHLGFAAPAAALERFARSWKRMTLRSIWCGFVMTSRCRRI